MLVHRERRMAIMIAAYAASSTKGANHDILQVLPLPKLARKGVSLMNPLISFFILLFLPSTLFILTDTIPFTASADFFPLSCHQKLILYFFSKIIEV